MYIPQDEILTFSEKQQLSLTNINIYKELKHLDQLPELKNVSHTDFLPNSLLKA